MYSFANHQTTVQDEHQDHRVEFKNGAFCKKTQGNVLVSPALRYPVRHERGNSQSRRDGRAFKVLGFAAAVLGYHGNCDVEASQTGQTAENKKCQEEMVERGADAECECCRGGGKAKGNLNKKTRA